MPDWDLGIVVVSELHSAIEALWHGVDPSHPLHRHPSAQVAGEGVIEVYKAVDRLVGTLATSFEDRDMIVFSMHGMGPNQSDVPSMLLLPELLYRLQFGSPFFQGSGEWQIMPNGMPIVGESDRWQIKTPDPSGLFGRAARSLERSISKRMSHLTPRSKRAAGEARKTNMTWMPAARYQPFWPKMTAFALPSYYDGSIRLNLRGRESGGLVPLDAYDSECRRIIGVLEACRDPLTGEGVVDHIERDGRDDPVGLHSSQGDMVVVWKGAPLALDHPNTGRIGPVPYRRTGGHTGLHGMAYLKSRAISPGTSSVTASAN